MVLPLNSDLFNNCSLSVKLCFDHNRFGLFRSSNILTWFDNGSFVMKKLTSRR